MSKYQISTHKFEIDGNTFCTLEFSKDGEYTNSPDIYFKKHDHMMLYRGFLRDCQKSWFKRLLDHMRKTGFYYDYAKMLNAPNE